MKVFKLPDLGEGLPDAEIVEWLVNEGDSVTVDQPLVSMETAKAVVEVPSPYTGKVAKFHGGAGDVIQTGAPLVEFLVDSNSDADAGNTGATDSPEAEPAAATEAAEPAPERSEAPQETAEPAAAEREDSGTVVGKMQ